MKYTASILLASAALAFTGCAPAPRMPYQKNVRAMSATSNAMFAHMMGGIGGVAFADEVVEGTKAGRELVSIEPLSGTNSNQAGKERWTVRHADGKKSTYLVTWSGDRFEVKPEKKFVPRN